VFRVLANSGPEDITYNVVVQPSFLSMAEQFVKNEDSEIINEILDIMRFVLLLIKLFVNIGNIQNHLWLTHYYYLC
jgi:hypothetical protein